MKRFVLLLLLTIGCAPEAKDGGITWHDEATLRWHDGFADGEAAGEKRGGVWNLHGFGNSQIDASSGDLVLTADEGAVEVGLHRLASIARELAFFKNVSMRVRITVEKAAAAGVGFNPTEEHGEVRTPASLSLGIRESDDPPFIFDPDGSIEAVLLVGEDILSDRSDMSAVPYHVLGEEILMQMDAFGESVKGSLWKEGDRDSLVLAEYPYTPALQGEVLILGAARREGTATVVVHEVWVSDRPIPIMPNDDD